MADTPRAPLTVEALLAMVRELRDEIGRCSPAYGGIQISWLRDQFDAMLAHQPPASEGAKPRTRIELVDTPEGQNARIVPAETPQTLAPLVTMSEEDFRWFCGRSSWSLRIEEELIAQRQQHHAATVRAETAERQIAHLESTLGRIERLDEKADAALWQQQAEMHMSTARAHREERCNGNGVLVISDASTEVPHD